MEKVEKQLPPKLKRVYVEEPRPTKDTRFCAGCRSTKDIDEFHRKCKYFKSCNDCSAKNMMKYARGEIPPSTKKTPEEIRAYNQRYYWSKQEEINARVYSNVKERRKISYNIKTICPFCMNEISKEYLRKHIRNGKCKSLHDTLEKKLFVNTTNEIRKLPRIM